MTRISGKRPVIPIKKSNRNSVRPIMKPLKRSETRFKEGHDQFTATLDRMLAKLDRIIEVLESAKPAPSLNCQMPILTDLQSIGNETPVLEETTELTRKPSSKLGNISISNFRKTCNQQLRSPFFCLPPELRKEIYDLVLISARPIRNPYAQVEGKRDDSTERIGDINSSVLMTCRLLYDEALPILYQKNLFVFHSPYEVILFNSGNGGRHISCERTERIARASLDIGCDFCSDRLQQMALEARGWVNGVLGDGTERITPLKQPLEAGYMFASLQELTLDFSRWSFTKSDLFPPSFLKGIKATRRKLKKLTVIGLEEHEEVEEALRQALLAESPPSNR